MDIKKIIKEELKGVKNSSEEDWGMFTDNIEWTEELLMEFLRHKDMEFRNRDGDEDFMLELDEDYDSGYTFIISWPEGDTREWVGYSLSEVLDNLNYGWEVINL